MTREQDAIVKEKTLIGIIEDRADCRELKQKKHINEFAAICFKELNILDKALHVSSHEGKDAKRVCGKNTWEHIFLPSLTFK